MANFNGPLLMQGPLSQMQDAHGSFVPYYNPCCGICKSGKPCGSKACGTPVVYAPQPTAVVAPPQYLAQPPQPHHGEGLPVRTGVTTLRLGDAPRTLGCGSCAAGAPGPAACPSCTVPVVTGGSVNQVPGGVAVSAAGVTTTYPSGTTLVTHHPGATALVSTKDPDCDEDAILCSLLKNSKAHYLNWHVDQPVYSVPNQALLPRGWENALNGFLPCTFDEHQYDGICSGCGTGGKCGDGGSKCKYKPGHFLITIEPSRTDLEKAYGPFVLAANGVRGRNLWLTRGNRYYFTFQACKLAVGVETGMPTPPSEGGVVVTETDTPFIFQPVSIIFTADTTARLDNHERTPLANTSPIPLWGTQWLYIAPQTQSMFYIVATYDAPPFNPASTALHDALLAAVLKVAINEQPTSSVPFPLA